MSYAQNGLIEATDFNNLVGAAVETGANKLNTTWSTGGTTAGYGQTAVSQVSGGDTVCLLYTSPSPRDRQKSRMPSSA